MELDTRKYEMFLKWYSMPESLRQPKTMDEFVDVSKISKQEISFFSEQDDFADRLVAYSLEWGKTKIPELLGLVFESARSTKNINHIKAFLGLVTDHDKKKREEEKEAKKKDESAKKESLRDLFLP